MTHFRGGFHSGVWDEALAPPTTTHWKMLKSIAMGSSIGSIDTHFTAALALTIARSVAVTRAWLSMVAPSQTLSGNSNSASLCGNFVSIRKFHSLASRTTARTASIHSAGTQLPNRSAIEHVKMFFQPTSSAASFGGAAFNGAARASGTSDGSNFCG